MNKLGLTDSEGTPKPKSKSKLSQCTKFVEIVSQLIESQKITDQKPIEIVDVGCGKGYLTFSLHNYLTSKNIETISTGVELRESLCDSINSIVSDLVETEPQFETLTFKPGYISSYVHYSKKVDVLIGEAERRSDSHRHCCRFLRLLVSNTARLARPLLLLRIWRQLYTHAILHHVMQSPTVSP